MPLPLFSTTDDELFPYLNLVIVGYVALIFLPRWKHTSLLTLTLVWIYSSIYILLLLHRFTISTVPLPSPIAFDTLDHISILFADRAALFAGWTHYIAFDLFVARHIIFDSQKREINHLFVVGLVPLTLFAGPAGLAVYYFFVSLFSANKKNQDIDDNKSKKE